MVKDNNSDNNVNNNGDWNIYAIHTDHLNTPRLLTNQNGAEVWRWASDAFGDSQATGSIEFNLRFPGQYYDGESGLHYNYFRDYNAQTGRYVQSDPIGLAGGLNTYGYAGNNPINYMDPLGLKQKPSTVKPSKFPKGVSCLQLREKCKKSVAQRCRQQHGNRVDQCHTEGAPNSAFAAGHQLTCTIHNSVNCTNTYVQCLTDFTPLPLRPIMKPILNIIYDNDIQTHPHFELR